MDHPSEEPVIKVGDRIDSAKVLDVNFSRASVQITGTKFASNSKVRARVHVTMADATPMSRPRRKVGVESAQEKETIGKAHPFYKWKKGTTLKNLVCVSAHVNRGVTLIELTNKPVDESNPSSFIKESSDLHPGMKVTGVIVAAAKSRRGVWLQPSPGINCFIPALELCQDVDILNDLGSYCPFGDRMILG